jgi:putative multiple sugar transport system ATP-binding protein
MSDVILEMRNITKSFPGVVALEDVNLRIKRGEIHAICGENGAGKSTLMKVLSGVYPFGSYSGEIVYDGGVQKFSSLRDSEAEGIVIIHQELALSPFLSIAENIFLRNEITKFGLISWNKTNAEAAKLMQRVGLKENPATPIKDVGVGKQQLVEIAKALSKEVKLLILDEPTSALNDEDSAHLLGLLRQLKEQGITSIMISHKLKEIESIADTTTILRDGRVVESLEMKKEKVTQERIIRGMVGREMAKRYPSRVAEVGEEIFRVENWNAYHPLDNTRKVVDDISITLKRGEILGLAGIMGAGRTEFARSLFGQSYGTRISGTAFVAGVEVNVSTVQKAIKSGLAYVTEDRKRFGLNLIEDIKRNITLASLKQFLRGPLVNANEEYRRATEYQQSMNIKAPSVLTVTNQLSGGNQQKVVLSKWINVEPKVLILDEPTRGIDVGAKYEIYLIIQRIASEGRGVIVISSELDELLGICDRIYAISEGRITGEVTRDNANPEALMKYMTMEKEITNV